MASFTDRIGVSFIAKDEKRIKQRNQVSIIAVCKWMRLSFNGSDSELFIVAENCSKSFDRT